MDGFDALMVAILIIAAMVVVIRALRVPRVAVMTLVVAPFVAAAGDADTRSRVFILAAIVGLVVAAGAKVSEHRPIFTLGLLVVTTIGLLVRALLPGAEVVYIHDVSPYLPAQRDVAYCIPACGYGSHGSGPALQTGSISPTRWISFALGLGLLVGWLRPRQSFGSQHLASLVVMLLLGVIAVYVGGAYGIVNPRHVFLAPIEQAGLTFASPALIFWPFLAIAAFFIGERLAAAASGSRGANSWDFIAPGGVR